MPFTSTICCAWELPPRARRIPPTEENFMGKSGTTSACAENTFHITFRRRSTRNYLRVRGEYAERLRGVTITEELPPRARRIPKMRPRPQSKFGTTSACAENTCGGWNIPRRYRNYLRVRGEYDSPSSTKPVALELPPRARRIPRARGRY